MTRSIVIPEIYTVTREGRVLSRYRGKLNELRQHINGSGHGYPSVWLHCKTWRRHYAVYRLVAHVYLPPRPSAKHFVCHRDGDRMNSRADNLYWGTAKENAYDAWKHRRDRQNLGLPFDADT